jgi:putative transcriptional regulator
MSLKIENSVRVWRARFDISQDALAKGIEVSRQTIHAIERGKFAPSVLTALKLAKYFNTTVENLFSIEGENDDHQG